MRAPHGVHALVLLLLFLPTATGCMPVRERPPAPRPGQSEPEAAGVILYDSTRHEFGRRTSARWEDSTLVVRKAGRETARYPVSQIYRVLHTARDAQLAATLGMVAAAALVILVLTRASEL